MSTETAQLVLAAILVIMTIVWLTALWFLISSYRSGITSPAQDGDQFGMSEQVPQHWLQGHVEVEGTADSLMEKAAALLLKASSGSLKVEKSRDGLSFERVGPRLPGLPEKGILQFSTVAGGQTRIDYALETSVSQTLLRVAAIIQICGLLALVFGGWAIYEFVATSPNLEIRFEVLQMIQVIHILWPPFLLAGLYRARLRGQSNQFWFLLRNLPSQK
jgi:hypothetical protein